jgi:TolA-binding protein
MKGIAVVFWAVVVAACGHGISPLVDSDAKDEIRFQEARTAYSAGMFEVAIDLFDRFLGEYPRSPRVAEAWYLTGRSRYEIGAWDEAISTLADMRARHPDSEFVRNASYYIGRSEYEGEYFPEAALELAAFEQAYPDSEYLDDSRYYLGRAYYDQGLFPESIGPLERVVAMLDTAFIVPASYYLGRSRFETADYTGAVPDFRRVLAKDPMGTFGDNSQYYVGRCLYNLDDFAGAVPELRKVETLYPASEYLDSARYYLGRSYYDRDMYAEAIAPLERLVGMVTTLRDDGLFHLGRSEFETGSLTLALGHLHELETAYPYPGPNSSFNDNSLYWQAHIHVDLGDCPSAIAATGRLVASQPASSELTRARSYLTSHHCTPVP